MKRVSLAIGTLVLGWALGACSSSDSTPAATDDGGVAPGGSSSGGGFNPSNMSGMKCATGGTSASMSKCTKAEDDAYDKCVADKCDSQYKKCLGDGYQKGIFSGECGGSLNCITKCACGDSACLIACQPPATCTSCYSELDQCTKNSGCKKCAAATTPGGMTGGGTATGGGCAALMVCCDSQAGQAKTDCNKIYEQIKASGDMACNAAVGAYKTAGTCK